MSTPWGDRAYPVPDEDVTFPAEEACIDPDCCCRYSSQCPDCGRATCTGEDCYWPGGEFDDRR